MAHSIGEQQRRNQQRLWHFSCCALVVAVSGSALLCPSPSSGAAGSGWSGKFHNGCLPQGSATTFITFMSNRNGNREVYVMRANGASPARLINNAAGDTSPALRNDRCRIAFASDRDNGFSGHVELTDIWSMRADGTGQARLTTGLSDGFNPSFNPNGTKIVFTATTGGLVWRNSNVYMMNANGSGRTLVSNKDDTDPVFSPNGQKIAVASGRATVPDDASINNSKRDIWIMSLNGSGQTQLTNNSANDRQPDWSPAGGKIVFMSERDGNPEIYIMNSDGSAQTRLTSNSKNDHSPVFSPNGKKIAWVSDRDGDNEIYTMNSDGTGQLKITDNAADDNFPHWR